MSDQNINARLRDLLGDSASPAASARGADPDGVPTLQQARQACPPGRVMRCHQDGAPHLLAVLADGRSFVTDAFCPHNGSPLDEAFVDGTTLVCRYHGWEFDLADDGRSPGRPHVRLPCRAVAATEGSDDGNNDGAVK